MVNTTRLGRRLPGGRSSAIALVALGTGFALGLMLAAAPQPAAATDPFITVASTTSTENSGLLGYILPQFKAATGIDVRVVAVGTGQALRMGRKGDADVVLVHDRLSEDAFVRAGYGVDRRDVMYNDFVIAGPRFDPAAIRGEKKVAAALSKIAGDHHPFLSRGDDSGTHKAEMRLWHSAGIDPTAASGTWYKETGSGMGATLNTASAMNAYTIADRGTWLSFRNRGDLVILTEGQPPLRNPYGVILVNPERHPHIKAAMGRKFIDWLVSDAGQHAIDSFRVDGQRLFHPHPKRTAAE